MGDGAIIASQTEVKQREAERQFEGGNKVILFHLVHLTEHFLLARHFQIYVLILIFIPLYIKYLYTHFQMGQVTFSEM